ncbi:tRNA lysidine(34) synthetase TilS [Sphingopyxis sp. 113P3]|uniref:tRNA lysidine(34) synthetase TilS n=1 Tax=Sphingopyxis sp. (strain 113P3) TaxID=292913 RepID=UPI0006BCFFF1|nr:tRNA lysidine(34) synthetase TilS [Sphingopyxis sp. 113P3]ALC12173.1 tRNA(Ile)-lysidine synthetase-like protein [Sphingopyxis sp. 113P3]
MPLPQKQKRAADAGSVERFAADLSALAGPDWHGKRYGVAVSGGPDSMALLWLMASLLPGQIAAATVDHRLRDASADEARMVAGYCAREHIPHAILHPATPIAGSLQAAARSERYRLLEQWREALALDHILTAHHADDQLETMIMRLNRSSGVGGLAGVRASNGAVLRPLLHWRRSELAALALDADLPIVEDPSNADRRFDRARLRHALRSQEFLDPQAASRSAQWLGDADTALDWAVEAAMAAWPDADDPSVIRDEAYPDEIFRRIVERRLRANDPQIRLRGETLGGLIAAMRAGRRAMVGELLIDVGKGSGAGFWRISAAPRRKGRV